MKNKFCGLAAMGMRCSFLPTMFGMMGILLVFTLGGALAQGGPDFELDPDDYSFQTNVHSPAEFEDWRQAVLDFYRDVMGMDESCPDFPLDLEYTETIQVGDGVTRSRIEYATTEGLRIPAYLFIPETAAPVPAMIVYHGHGAGKINAAEGVGTNENALALYIAENLGYVVLAPDARSFGEFDIPRRASHVDYYFGLILTKQLYMAKLMEDGCRDMALLRSLPQVDADRIGAAGISMGSWRTLNHAVLQQDVGAAVVSGLFIPWDYLFSDKHCKCQHIPRLAEKMSMEDLAATIFPRRLLIQWGLEDQYHGQDGEGLIERTAAIARFLGMEDSFVVDRHPGMGHRFSNPEIANFFHEIFGDGAWTPKALE